MSLSFSEFAPPLPQEMTGLQRDVGQRGECYEVSQRQAVHPRPRRDRHRGGSLQPFLCDFLSHCPASDS